MKEKIPFYNIVNMFFIGAVFSLGMIVICYKNIPFDLLKENSEYLSDWSFLISTVLLITMYEIGFIINRMSSIIIAPILEKTNIWPKDEYHIDVSEISKENSKFQSMITDLILMRSHIMLYLIFMVASIVLKKWSVVIFCLLLISVFIFSGRKHNSKINIIRRDYCIRECESKNEFKNKTTN